MIICFVFQYRVVSDFIAEFGNCSLFFEFVDTNDNGFVGLHEGIVALAKGDVFDFGNNKNPELKMTQIDCSKCLNGNKTLYYM